MYRETGQSLLGECMSRLIGTLIRHLNMNPNGQWSSVILPLSCASRMQAVTGTGCNDWNGPQCLIPQVYPKPHTLGYIHFHVPRLSEAEKSHRYLALIAKCTYIIIGCLTYHSRVPPSLAPLGRTGHHTYVGSLTSSGSVPYCSDRLAR